MLCVILGTPGCGTELEGMALTMALMCLTKVTSVPAHPIPTPTLCPEVVPATFVVLGVWPSSQLPELAWVPGLFTRVIFFFCDEVAHGLCSLVQITTCLLFFCKDVSSDALVAFLNCGSVGLGLYLSSLGNVNTMRPIKTFLDHCSVIFTSDVFRAKLPLWSPSWLPSLMWSEHVRHGPPSPFPCLPSL